MGERTESDMVDWSSDLLRSGSERATVLFFLMIRRPPRSTLDRSSAASDVYKRQAVDDAPRVVGGEGVGDEVGDLEGALDGYRACLLYTSPSPRDRTRSRMPSSA